MVKITAVLLFVVLCAVPALAQEEFPRIQTSLGYANLGFFDFGSTTGASARHSGFANETSFNFTKNWGVSNYMGFYGLGGGVEMISDFVGGKAMYRTSRLVPYGTAGIGFGYITASYCYSYFGCGGNFATRYGGGVDIPINDTFSWKVEVTRMSFHVQTSANSNWSSGTNIQTGIVFTLAQ